MSDDSSPPPAPPDLPPSPDRRQHEDDDDDAAGDEPSQSAAAAATPEQQRRRHRGGRANGRRRRQTPSLSKKAREGLTKKLEFLTLMAFNLDALVYAELCVLYYMDCSFVRLMVRWLAQSLFISPKTEDSILIVPNYHVSAIVGPNLLCLLLHLFSPVLQAGEATRGYLHGGILIDFVGQKPPSSRLVLLLLDMVVLGLQCFMMTVNVEKEKIRKVVRPPRRSAGAGITLNDVPATNQDHDAEERGILRDAPMMDETNDIEMQPMGNNEGDVNDNRRDGGEATGLLRPAAAQRGSEFEALADSLISGNAVLANFDIRQALQTAWQNRENTPEGAAAYAIQNVGYNATLAALAAQRRARLASAQRRGS
ncbi:Uu.00g046070.m01.CDS01 [Anthostomella pinea]|uniref:Uu.00g046070.m01.CDS01 n=1 Tax=Anthostomella pinea TaxID=933095 RepID=A0AAI8VB91_9PEZI|nr:Uu.00g046070.m01.CDS01 [Anthostomella pinea]